jgi:hypothetical protein
MTLPPSFSLRRAGGFALAAGAAFVAVGAGAWSAVTGQLREENITVPPNAPAFAGKPVIGPLTAFAQAVVIKRNAEQAAGGRTFADVGAALHGLDPESVEGRELREQGASLSTAAALRTALLLSVLAYGVSAFAAGLGVVLVVVGAALRRAGRR